MAYSYQRAREEFIARCVLEAAFNRGNFHTPDNDLPHVRAILKDAQTHQRLAEYACNVGTDDAWTTKVARVQKRIIEHARALGFGVPMFSGDPRGATVKLRMPSGYSDSWGGEGLCVPTR